MVRKRYQCRTIRGKARGIDTYHTNNNHTNNININVILRRNVRAFLFGHYTYTYRAH